jgi:outer membrane PBP1 activator LpoA protein
MPIDRLLVFIGLLSVLLSVCCMGCANSRPSSTTLEQQQQRLNAEHFQYIERMQHRSGGD